MNVELKQIHSLVTLAELGSISLTAQRLHLCPAAIHKQLKALEAELEARLYERIGRRLQLTQTAEVLLPYLKDALAQLDAARSALEEWKGMKRGQLRLGAGPALSSSILPVFLRKFRRVYPLVDLLVETGTAPVVINSLRQGSLDLALLVSSDLTEGPDIRVEAHWDFEMVLVSRLRQAPRRCSLAELEGFPFILFSKGSRVGEPIDRYFAAHGFRPRVIMRSDTAEAIKAMIRTGLGISMLPMWSVDSELRQGRLWLIRQAEPPLLSKIAWMSRESSFVPHPVQAFIALAQKAQWKAPRLTSGAVPAGHGAAGANER